MQIKVRDNHMEEIEDIRPEYPYTCHHVEMRNTLVPWHWHEEVEFDRVVRGTVLLKTAGRTLEFGEGEGFFTNSNVLCSMEGNAKTILKSHLFHPVFLSGHYHSIFETKYINPVLQNRKLDILEFREQTGPQKEILLLLQKAEGCFGKDGFEFTVRNIFSDIWMLLLEVISGLAAEEVPVPSRDQERLLYMISYMQEHYSEKITLEQIAAAAMVSVRESNRCCKKAIGMTPYEYLMEYRLEMAKKMLQKTDRSVLDIANDAGFSSSAYFGKIFRRATGMTPGQFRKVNHGTVL